MASVSTLWFLKLRLYSKSRLFDVKFHFGNKILYFKLRLYVKSRFIKSRLYCIKKVKLSKTWCKKEMKKMRSYRILDNSCWVSRLTMRTDSFIHSFLSFTLNNGKAAAASITTSTCNALENGDDLIFSLRLVELPASCRMYTVSVN